METQRNALSIIEEDQDLDSELQRQADQIGREFSTMELPDDYLLDHGKSYEFDKTYEIRDLEGNKIGEETITELIIDIEPEDAEGEESEEEAAQPVEGNAQIQEEEVQDPVLALPEPENTEE